MGISYRGLVETMSGLLLRTFVGLRWLDQFAALAAVPILVVEARRLAKAKPAHAVKCESDTSS